MRRRALPRTDPEVLIIVASDPLALLEARLELAHQRWRTTRRQLDVLRPLARGESNKGIATELGCAEVTVEAHVSALLRRTRSRSRAELVARFWTLL